MNSKKKLYIGLRYLRLINFVATEKITSFYDKALYQFGILEHSIRYKNTSSKKRIVFAGQTVNHRVIKNIKWLKSTNLFEIIVVCHKASVKDDLLASYYNKLIEFRNITHLKRIIKGANNIDLVVGFSSKPSYAEIAIKYSNVPTIFDAYDCMVMYHGKTSHLGWLKKELISEEYCFKNADAILARSPENYLALKMFAIDNKPSLFFADYCDNDYFTNTQLTINDSKSEISIAYSGGILGKHLKNKLSQGLTDFYALIEELEKQQVHFNIYPSPFLNKEQYYDYIEASQTLDYLHVHESVLQKNLAKELSNYHFGVLPHFRTGESKITDDKLDRGTSLKFYNYLEAGIPILVSSEMKYMSWIVKRYGIGIVFDRKDFPNIRQLILSHDYNMLKSNVIQIREKLSMKNNLPRLISFINKLITPTTKK